MDKTIEAKEKPKTDWLLNGSLLALVLLGLFFRFYNLRWDECRLLHPDERFVASVVIRVHLPASLGVYLNSVSSPFNPVNVPDVHYVYGQLPLLLSRWLLEGVNWINSLRGVDFRIADEGQFVPFGRFLSAFFDCLTVLITFVIGRRLLGVRGGLIAAAFVSLSALHIQQSHFLVVDTFAAAFLGLALYLLLLWLEGGKRIWALGCGVAFGCAVACKFSALLFVPTAIVATVVVCKRFGVVRALSGLGLVLFAGFALFRIGHPMAFIGGWGPFGILDIRPDARFWNDMRTQQVITQGEMDVPFNIQWIGRTPWLYSLGNLWSWGWGYAFSLAALVGLGALAHGVKTRQRARAEVWVFLFFGLSLFLIQGAAFSKFTRYYLPLTPIAAVLAAYGLVWAVEKWPKVKTVQLLAPVGTAVWAMAVCSIYTHRHTRLLATDWIRTNVPSGSAVANQTAWDEGLPLGWIPWPDGGYKADQLLMLDLDAFQTDSPSKTQDLLTKLDKTQWIFLSSNRAWGTTPRWPERYPIMKRFYQTLFDGTLGFELKKEFTSYPSLGPWVFPDGQVEEALTVYDHPRVLIYERTAAWNPEKVRRMLSEIPPPPRDQKWQPRLAPAPDEADLPRPRG